MQAVVRLAAAALLALPPAPNDSAPNAARAAVATTGTVRVSGVARRYRLHVPPALPDGPAPLVVAFHGAGATAAVQERASGLSALADRAGFVVVYPEGRARRWAADDADEAFVRAVVADVARRVHVDPRRVYATGVSNGARMAERAGCEMSDLFAAIATVAGVYPEADVCRAAEPVPVLAIHGLRDQLAPFDGRGAAPGRRSVPEWVSTWAARNGCAPTPAVVDGPLVTTEAWGGCAGGADVVLDVVRTVGHGWPGDPTDPEVRSSPLDASGAIWAFFESHPKS
jgi:polyhydroxybutyrate depolymerase